MKDAYAAGRTTAAAAVAAAGAKRAAVGSAARGPVLKRVR